MLDSAQLATFAAVVQEGSFDAAARVLHVTPSAVSQRIKLLEQAVGQVLVRRAKPCRATEAGQPLLRLAGQISLLEREAVHAARGRLGAGTRLSIVVNSDSLATWFLAALRALPPDRQLTFDLREDDQDHTAELLRDGSVMAAVTAQNIPVQGCAVTRLGAMRYQALVAPELAGVALDAVPMLVFSRKDQLQHRFLRKLTRRRVEPPIHYIPSVPAFNEAVRLGLGWGMMPEQLAAPYLADGSCVELAPGRYLDVPLYWQHWRLDSDLLKVLTEVVTTVAAQALR